MQSSRLIERKGNAIIKPFDITFGLQVVESSSFVSVLFIEVFNHPYIFLFHLLVNVFLLLVSVLFEDPLPSFNWWGGGEKLKWRQLANHQLMSMPKTSF